MTEERDEAADGRDEVAPPPPPSGPAGDAPPAPLAVPPPGAVDPDDGPTTQEHVAVFDDDLVDDATPASPAPPPVGRPSPEPPAAAAEAAPVNGQDTGEQETRPGRRWVRWTLVGAAAVLGALYVAGYVLTGQRLPADTTIGGVDVGGVSPAAARAAVDRELSPRADDELTLVFEDQQFVLAPADIGLAFDLAASVEQAGGERSWDPRDMIELAFGGQDHDPVLEVDEELLTSAVATIRQTVDVEVVEALITFPDGVPELREPVPGRVVPVAEAREVITDAYLGSGEPVAVPTAAVDPQVDSAGLQQALTEIAEPAVSGPVRLLVGEKQVELPVSAYAPALSVRVEDGAMKPYLDPELLAEPLTSSVTGIGEQAVDASIDIVDGAPVITPGKPGVGLQPQEMAVALLPALTETGDARAVAVQAQVVDPLFTTADAEALQIKEKIGEFTTYYPHADYRNVNQARGAELIDGVVLEPGETFSFNDTVGERTSANGFTSGFVINGGVFREELGGGVSQVVTTLYNAAFFAGMDDVEHHPHAFYIDRYPMGREATVYYGSLDLRFRNPTDHGVLIDAWVDRSTPGRQGTMHVELWGTKMYDVEAGASAQRNFRTPATRYDESPACVPQAPITGFDIDIYRTFKQNGQVVKRETDAVVYQAADRVICGPRPPEPPAAVPAPPPGG